MKPSVACRPGPSRVVAYIALALFGLAAVVYCSRLDFSPVYLTKDEASFAIQSHSLATTGRDIAGHQFPLFFQEPGFEFGRDPIYIYASALVLQFLPLDARAVRLPSALAGAISVGLVVLVAAELFGGASPALLAGVLLAVTPAFFIRSRAALSVIFPVPFQLVWLWLLLRYMRTGRLSALVGSTVALGVGTYSYLSMVAFVPMHFAATSVGVAIKRRWPHLAVAMVCLMVTLVPLLAWQLAHPNRYADLIGSYHVYDPKLNVLQGARDLLSWFSLGTRVDMYWQAFNPSRLFFFGESGYVDSTRTAGLFPAAYIVLLPIGLYEFARWPMSFGRAAILLTFFCGPIPGIIAGNETIGRYLVIGPIAALLAVTGALRLWNTRYLLAKVFAVVLVLSAPWQFRQFYADYMGDWRINSSAYLGGNLKGAMDVVMKAPVAEAPEVVFLSERIPYVDVFYQYYLRANNRPDLSLRSRGLSMRLDDWRHPSRHAVAILPANELADLAAMAGAGWRKKVDIFEFYGGLPTFVVLEAGD